MTKAECLDCWVEHFQHILNCPLPLGNDDLPNNPVRNDNMDICIQPVTEAEVAAGLEHIKSSCSTGICSITAELLKVGGVSLTHWLIHIINEVWIKEELPDDWKFGVIWPFWKHKASKLICSNHWSISLCLMSGTFFIHILLAWALPAICCKCRVQQASFMPNHSTINHILAVQHTVEKQQEFLKE